MAVANIASLRTSLSVHLYQQHFTFYERDVIYLYTGPLSVSNSVFLGNTSKKRLYTNSFVF